MQIQEIRYHIHILQSELTRRKLKNSRYSLRAFASQLEMHPSALSRILAGKQELSLQSALIVIAKLAMTEYQKHHFINSVAQEKYQQALATLAPALGSKGDFEAFKFRALIESLDSLCFCMMADGQMDDCNPAFKNWLGFDPVQQEIKETWWQSCVAPEAIPLMQSEFNSGISKAVEFSLTTELRHRDGRYHRVRMNYLPSRDSGRVILGWIGHVRVLDDPHAP